MRKKRKRELVEQANNNIVCARRDIHHAINAATAVGDMYSAAVLMSALAVLSNASLPGDK